MRYLVHARAASPAADTMFTGLFHHRAGGDSIIIEYVYYMSACLSDMSERNS